MSILQETMLPSTKNTHSIQKMCFAPFCDTGVYPITENISVFLELIEVIWKTAANPGKMFTQSYAEKYDGVSALHRMKFDLVLQKI